MQFNIASVSIEAA